MMCSYLNVHFQGQRFKGDHNGFKYSASNVIGIHQIFGNYNVVQLYKLYINFDRLNFSK